MDTWTDICGPFPGGLILTHTQMGQHAGWCTSGLLSQSHPKERPLAGTHRDNPIKELPIAPRREPWLPPCNSLHTPLLNIRLYPKYRGLDVHHIYIYIYIIHIISIFNQHPRGCRASGSDRPPLQANVALVCSHVCGPRREGCCCLLSLSSLWLCDAPRSCQTSELLVVRSYEVAIHKHTNTHFGFWVCLQIGDA